MDVDNEDSLERRLDKLEQWHAVQDAVANRRQWLVTGLISVVGLLVAVVDAFFQFRS